MLRLLSDELVKISEQRRLSDYLEAVSYALIELSYNIVNSAFSRLLNGL